MSKRIFWFCGAVSLALAGRASALFINIEPVPGGGLDPSSATYNAAAAAAFQFAASAWDSEFSDPVTVNVTADFTSAGFDNPLTIGETSNVIISDTYSNVRDALISDSAGQPDKAIVNSLPVQPKFLFPSGTANGFPYKFISSGNIESSKADFKALGYTDLDSQYGESDGAITFNSSFPFSYTGPQPGTIDFRTAAEHEIGHLLGFVSSVDNVDFMVSGLIGAPLDHAYTFSIDPSLLDMYRFNSSQLPTSALAFSTTPRDLTPGANDYTSDSLNNYQMSTGFYEGDGRQASHWKDDELTGTTIGIMDPTLGFGVSEGISSADLRALELIGWDAVPEPGSLGLLGLFAAQFALRRRRKRV